MEDICARLLISVLGRQGKSCGANKTVYYSDNYRFRSAIWTNVQHLTVSHLKLSNFPLRYLSCRSKPITIHSPVYLIYAVTTPWRSQTVVLWKRINWWWKRIWVMYETARQKCITTHGRSHMRTKSTLRALSQFGSRSITIKYFLRKFLSWVNVYNQSAPGNQHFCELLSRANDVIIINIYIWRQIQLEMQDLAANEVYSV